MNKTEYFKNEYTYIKDEKKREDLKNLVNILPDYFFEIPASSTGKYHPSYASGKQGLIRHVKAAVAIAHCLLEDETFSEEFTQTEQDLMIMALVLHDGLKLGLSKGKWTRFDHPLLICDFIKKNDIMLTMTDEEINLLCDMIKTHMGPWIRDPYTYQDVLEKPKTKTQKFVHLCDYLASRKFLEVPFEGMEIKGINICNK